MPGLSPTRRRELKVRAHALDPVVLIGGAGLSPAAGPLAPREPMAVPLRHEH